MRKIISVNLHFGKALLRAVESLRSNGNRVSDTNVISCALPLSACFKSIASGLIAKRAEHWNSAHTQSSRRLRAQLQSEHAVAFKTP